MNKITSAVAEFEHLASGLITCNDFEALGASFNQCEMFETVDVTMVCLWERLENFGSRSQYRRENE